MPHSLAELLNRRAIYITHHALERFREHDPAAQSWRDMIDPLYRTTEVDPDVARSLLQRHVAPRGVAVGRYFLAHDHRGIFAAAPPDPQRNHGHTQLVIVTYLRFSPSQQELVDRLYPPETT